MEMQEVVEHMFLPLPGVPSMLVKKTEGVYIEDANGNKIIDASGGALAVSIGHGRREVAEAARKAMEEVTYILPVFATEKRIELVRRIRKVVPPELSEIYFCSGGSEANEAAIKLARQYHVLKGNDAKCKIVSRNLSYHGMTFLALSISDIKARRRDFMPMLWKNPRIEAPYCYRCPFGKEYPGCDIDCAKQLEDVILEEGPESVAVFIAEPMVASAGGAFVPPPEYYPIVRETCDKYDVFFIADEIVTGFGRTGEKMGLDHYGVVPDAATFAKGVSSAYAPLAGMAVKKEVADLFAEKQADFQHLYTFSAHPLVCAVGAEVQRIIEDEQLMDRAVKMGRYMKERLSRLEEFSMVGDVRGKGMLWGIEFVKDRQTKEPFPKEKNVKMNVMMKCLMKGVFFYPGYYEDEQGRGDHLLFVPPFIITEEQIDQCVDTLAEVLKDSQDRYYEE